MTTTVIPLRLVLSSFVIVATWVGGDVVVAQQETSGLEIAMKELRARRRALRQDVVKLAQKSDDAWKVKRKKPVIITLSQYVEDPRVARHLDTMARSTLKWLQSQFGSTWKKEDRPDRLVLRVCNSPMEIASFLGGTYSAERRESACLGRNDRSILNAFSTIAESLSRQYFDLRHPAARDLAPSWFRNGFAAHVSRAGLSKKRGMYFGLARDPVRRVVEMIRKKEMLLVRDVVGRPKEQLLKGRFSGERDVGAMSELVVRYFTDGPGRKGKTKGALGRYLGAFADAAWKRDAKGWGKILAASAAEMTAVQLAEAFVEFEKKSRWTTGFDDEAREDMRRRARFVAFKSMSNSDWAKLQSRFESWVKKGAR